MGQLFGFGRQPIRLSEKQTDVGGDDQKFPNSILTEDDQADRQADKPSKLNNDGKIPASLMMPF